MSKKTRIILIVSASVFIAIGIILGVLFATVWNIKNPEEFSFKENPIILYVSDNTPYVPELNTSSSTKDYILSIRNSTICSLCEDSKSIIAKKEGITDITATSGDKTTTSTIIVYSERESDIIPVEVDGKYAVVFNTSYGAIPTQRVLPGETATLPEAPQRSDQRILGWYTDEEYTALFDFSTPITQDTLLYAKWGPTENPTFSFAKLTDGTICVAGLNFPNVQFEKLTIPTVNNDGETVTAIKKNAFQDYTYVTEIVIPAGITVIDEYAFAGCTSLQKITFDGNSALVKIGKEAFWNCVSLNTFVLPETLSTISEGCFNNCKKYDANIPSAVTRINQQSFMDSGITAINLENVTYIGLKAFYGCKNLATVTNANKINTILADTFSETLWYQNQATANKSEGGVVYLGTIALGRNSTTADDITLRANTTKIAPNAFYTSKDLILRITNTSFVVERGEYGTYILGTQSNTLSTETVHIVVPESMYDSYLSSWSTCKNNLYYRVDLAGGNLGVLARKTTYNSTEIYSVVLTKYTGLASTLDVTSLLTTKFGTNVYVERIKTSAFYNLSTLTSVYIPVRTHTIETNAFNYCRNLTSIKFTGSYTASDIESYTTVTANSFYLLANNFIIYVPQGRSYNGKSSWASYYNKSKVVTYIPD